MQLTKHLRVSSFQIITGSFLGIILLGAFVLMLPVSSSAEGIITPFGDALFTSTSAVCVTGLVVHDTFRYWSLFGQFVILFLIQIGGLGTITLAVVATMLAGRKVSLFQRSIMKEAVSADQYGDCPLCSIYSEGYPGSGVSGSYLSLPCFLPEIFTATVYSIFPVSFHLRVLQRGL